MSLREGAWKRVDARGLGVVFSLAAHPEERDTLVAGTRDGLLISRDGGESWEALGRSLRGVPVTAVGFSPQGPHILLAYAVHPELGLIRSGDGGLTWRPLGLFLDKEDAVSHIAVHADSGTRLPRHLPVRRLPLHPRRRGVGGLIARGHPARSQ